MLYSGLHSNSISQEMVMTVKLGECFDIIY